MQSRVGALIALWLCGSAAFASQPGEDPLARRGEQVAERVCAACHVVVRDQEFPPFLKIHTPSFFEIARRPETTERSLRHFITTTHWDEQTIPMTMPNQELTPEQVRAVVHYILSLR